MRYTSARPLQALETLHVYDCDYWFFSESRSMSTTLCGTLLSQTPPCENPPESLGRSFCDFGIKDVPLPRLLPPTFLPCVRLGEQNLLKEKKKKKCQRKTTASCLASRAQ